MAPDGRGRATSRVGLLAALAGLLLGCSGGGGGHHDAVLPDPAPGKVAALDLNTLSSHYDLTRMVNDFPLFSFEATDRSGNAYLMDTGPNASPDIVRMTSEGAVSRFAARPSGRIGGMTAEAPGVLVVGRGSQLLSVRAHGPAAALATGHTFVRPKPIGVRPDGSLVVVDDGRVWAVKDGRTTVLAGRAGEDGNIATVDASGTVYVLLSGQTIGDMLVILPGEAPRTPRLSGTVPGRSAPLSGLLLNTVAPDRSGGFYAMAGPADGTMAYLVRVRGTRAQVLAASTVGADGSYGDCRAGQQFAALRSPCQMPWQPVPVGARVLVVGETAETGYDLTLVVRADSTAPASG